MKIQPLRWISVAAVAAAAYGLSGCGDSGPKGWPVVGKVTFAGRPVLEATIRFSKPEAGIDVIAAIGPDGAYSVAAARGAGLPEGTYRVAVMPAPSKPPRGPMLGPPPPAPKRPDVPEKYRQTISSGLTATVKPDSNSFDVDMLPK